MKYIFLLQLNAKILTFTDIDVLCSKFYYKINILQNQLKMFRRWKVDVYYIYVYAIIFIRVRCCRSRELEATGRCALQPITPVSVQRWDEQNAEGHKMNASSCRHRPVIMYQQSSGADLNGSWDFLAPRGNLTSAAAALQLPTFTTAAKVRVIVTFILCGISTFCNLAALWAVNGQKRKSHVRVLIINLTVADLLVTFIVMPVDAVWNITVQWVASDLACRILMFLKLQAMYSCAFVTVVISLDRQFAILNPLAIIMARRRNKVMLTVAWTMSAVLSIPQVRHHSGYRQ